MPKPMAFPPCHYPEVTLKACLSKYLIKVYRIKKEGREKERRKEGRLGRGGHRRRKGGKEGRNNLPK